MATLSANSRRNSSTSTVSNSPRASLTTNGNALTETPKTKHMQSLHEEDVISEPIPLPPPPIIVPIKESPEPDQTDTAIVSVGKLSTRITKENTCTERSDSGFSDCSTSSGGVNVNNNVHSTLNVTSSHPLFDKANSISEEKLSNIDQNHRENGSNNVKEIGAKLSVNMLKLKLEKIAEAQQETKTFRKTVNKLPSPQPIINNDVSIEFIKQNNDLEKQSSLNALNSLSVENLSESEPNIKFKSITETASNAQYSLLTEATPTQKTNLMRSASLQHKRIVEKEPIMKSDFTNTVKMRKKSLESNALREKTIHSPRILLEPSGKVSKLLQRFDFQNTSLSTSDLNTETDSPEPIVESPIENSSNSVPFEENANQQSDHEIVEILKTPLSHEFSSSQYNHASPLQSLSPNKHHHSATKSIRSSTTVSSSSSMKRNITTSTKSSVCIETKVSSPRVSPTKFTNTQNFANNRSKLHSNQSNQNNLMKKSFQKSNTAEAATATIPAKHSQAIAVRNAKGANATASHQKTAYASFNRTSPIRLSGRVKEVTDRLSSPKQIIKRPVAIRSTGTTVATRSPSPNKFNIHSATGMAMTKSIAQEHTSTIKHSNSEMSCCSTITKTQQLHQIFTAETEIETEEHIERTINGKIDGGDFTMKSKMNENFRKASAFWKTT